MLTVICECGTQFENIDWEENNWFDMWRTHGHFPGRCTLLCPCGAHRDIGPETMSDEVDCAEKAAEVDGAWWDLHRNCKGMVN